MRHHDDDLSPFRDDPVVQALTGPATEAELAGEADAVAAYRDAVPASAQRRRSAARVATGSAVAVVTLAVSGGVAAAYTASFPDSWQQKLHTEFHAIGVPAPKHHKSTPPRPTSPAVAAPAPSLTPVPAPPHTGAGTPQPRSTPTTVSSSATTPSPASTPSLPVAIPTPTVSSPETPTPTPTPTESRPPVAGGQIQISVAPGTRVAVGTQLTVSGKLTAADGTAIANRRVVLVDRVVGETGRQRVGSARTDASGEVTISGPSVQRNLRLLLRAGRGVRSQVERVVVVPLIHVEVPATPAGATAVTVSVAVSGAQAGDVVILRGPGARDGRRGTLDGSLATTFTVPVSQTSALHYRVFVPRTNAHAAHALAFYVPASGG